MKRALFKLALLITTLFVIPILLIHAQPYDNSELRAFLMPDDCLAPCFMGIRPGVTTVDDAINELARNAWVKEIQVLKNGATQETDRIIWSWSETHPSYLRDVPNMMLNGGNLTVEDNRVQFISIPTSFSLGEIWLGWGKPDQYSMTTVQGLENSPVRLPYSILYTHLRIVVNSVADCAYASTFLFSQVNIDMGNEALPVVETEYDSGYDFRHAMVENQRKVCKG
jgi:hypothetical protein